MTLVIPKYDVAESKDLLVAEAEALKTLGATTLITSATPFGSSQVQVLSYPTNEHRRQLKANIKGETNG